MRSPIERNGRAKKEGRKKERECSRRATKERERERNTDKKRTARAIIKTDADLAIAA